MGLDDLRVPSVASATVTGADRTYAGLEVQRSGADGNGRHVALVIRRLAGRSGGAERIFCELADMLADAGHRVTCLTYETGSAAPFYPIDPRVELINLHPTFLPVRDALAEGLARVLPNGIRGRDHLVWARANSFFVSQLRTYMRTARPDVVISVLPPANTPVLLAARDLPVKVVVTNHNVPEGDYDSPARWDKNPVDRKLRKQALSRADAIHVLFPRFGDWFPSDLQPRIRPIPNYVSDDIMNSMPASVRGNTILAVGRLAAVKNYSTLLAAWAQLPELHDAWSVEIYGVGPDERVLKAEISRLGLERTFRLCGHQPHLGEIYRRSAVFCHPALFEGFGLAPAEALACGVPVVAYKGTPGISEFLVDGHNSLLVDRGEMPGDPAKLAGALRTLITDEALRQKLAGNAASSVAPFGKERYRKAWLELVRELCGEESAT